MYLYVLGLGTTMYVLSMITVYAVVMDAVHCSRYVLAIRIQSTQDPAITTITDYSVGHAIDAPAM